MEYGINIPESPGKRGVVIGAGFGGINVVKGLKNAGMQIVVVDKNNYHQFQPLLYQVATSGLEPTAIAFPVRGIFKGFKNFHFLMSEVKKIEPTRNVIATEAGELSYDFLVIAAGADTNYFGIENIRHISMGLKSVPEALQLRNRIYKSMEIVSRVVDEKEKEKFLNFVVVGGGATGIELAGAVAELRRKVLPRDFPEIDFSQMKIFLLNANERLLDAFQPQTSEKTKKDLQAMGIIVMNNAKVADYRDDAVIYNNEERIYTKNVVWASGIIANVFDGIDNLGQGKRIITDKYCRVKRLDGGIYDNLYAIGDIAVIPEYVMPQVAQVAIQQAQLAVYNITHEDKIMFTYKDKGKMATIGRNKAVAEIDKKRFSGFFAWFLWLFIHLLYIIGFRSRLEVFSNWVWNYVARDQPIRSIIEIKRDET